LDRLRSSRQNSEMDEEGKTEFLTEDLRPTPATGTTRSPTMFAQIDLD
jgi:hypothetical protein